MKALLPALAAALLLAAAPVFADDLLDAVLWDGPSAFPSQTESAPEPPPPPAPAPSYPSRSSFAPSTPSPSPPPPPAAPVPSATATVPAVDEPVPVSGESQIRREIQEMRARADRLEAALGPAEPPNPTPVPHVRAGWLKHARLSLDGTPDNQGYACAAEFALSVAETPFDAAIRGYWLGDVPDDSSGYVSSSRHFTFDAGKRVQGATVWGLWLPWRDVVVSPHAGVGVGYEFATGHRTYREYTTGWGYDSDGSWAEDLEDSGLTLAGRVGATLTYQRFTLKGEIILTSETKIFLAEAGLRVWEHLVLNGLVERYDLDLSEACNAYGGGITILF